MRYERQQTDMVVEAVARAPAQPGRTASFEHAGIFVAPRQRITNAGQWRKSMLNAARAACPLVEEKTYPDGEGVMAILRSQRQVPTEEWDRRDEWWLDTELARLELARRVRAGAKSMDMLIGSLVAKVFVGDRLFQMISRRSLEVPAWMMQ